MLASLVGAISAGQIADRDNGDPEAASRRSSGDNSDSEPLRQWRSRPGSGIGDRETDVDCALAAGVRPIIVGSFEIRDALRPIVRRAADTRHAAMIILDGDLKSASRSD